MLGRFTGPVVGPACMYIFASDGYSKAMIEESLNEIGKYLLCRSVVTNQHDSLVMNEIHDHVSQNKCIE